MAKAHPFFYAKIFIKLETTQIKKDIKKEFKEEIETQEKICKNF